MGAECSSLSVPVRCSVTTMVSSLATVTPKKRDGTCRQSQVIKLALLQIIELPLGKVGRLARRRGALEPATSRTSLVPFTMALMPAGGTAFVPAGGTALVPFNVALVPAGGTALVP
eukprot:Hpha_TRINITY_DN15349_c2_g3::TRINITY_DN15349_c2_g3_i13::g.90332::m.90332